MSKKLIATAFACLLVSACSGSDTVERDADGNIVLDGTWSCERVGGAAAGQVEITTSYTFGAGKLTALQEAKRSNGQSDVEGETRIEFNYTRTGDRLYLKPTDIELIAMKLNGEEQTGRDLEVAQAQMARGLAMSATFDLSETEDGDLIINDRGQHRHQCTRG